MSTIDEEPNNHANFKLAAHMDSLPSHITPVPSMASKLDARGYPPNTYTLPPSPGMYPNCNGKPGAYGHVRKCKTKPTISPDSNLENMKTMTTTMRTTSTMAVKTVWVDAPTATTMHVKRRIVDAELAEVSEQDVARLPAEIKAYTTQAMPSLAEQQHILGNEIPTKPLPTSNLCPELVGTLTLQDQLRLERLIRARIGEIDYEIKLTNCMWAAFSGIAICLVVLLVMLLTEFCDVPSDEEWVDEERMEDGVGGDGEKYADKGEAEVESEDEDEGEDDDWVLEWVEVDDDDLEWVGRLGLMLGWFVYYARKAALEILDLQREFGAFWSRFEVPGVM